MQQHADVYLLLNYSTCFGRPSRISSGLHKTVVAASGTDHTIWGASFLKRDQILWTGIALLLSRCVHCRQVDREVLCSEGSQALPALSSVKDTLETGRTACK